MADTLSREAYNESKDLVMQAVRHINPYIDIIPVLLLADKIYQRDKRLNFIENNSIYD